LLVGPQAIPSLDQLSFQNRFNLFCRPLVGHAG
jgi:hypothetical protein